MTSAEDLPVPSVALVVLDGWALAPPGPGNAVSPADTPVFDDLWSRFPRTELEASGPESWNGAGRSETALAGDGEPPPSAELEENGGGNGA